jgi:hypothetical protein
MNKLDGFVHHLHRHATHKHKGWIYPILIIIWSIDQVNPGGNGRDESKLRPWLCQPAMYNFFFQNRASTQASASKRRMYPSLLNYLTKVP